MFIEISIFLNCIKEAKISSTFQKIAISSFHYQTIFPLISKLYLLFIYLWMFIEISIFLNCIKEANISSTFQKIAISSFYYQTIIPTIFQPFLLFTITRPLHFLHFPTPCTFYVTCSP